MSPTADSVLVTFRLEAVSVDSGLARAKSPDNVKLPVIAASPVTYRPFLALKAPLWTGNSFGSLIMFHFPHNSTH